MEQIPERKTVLIRLVLVTIKHQISRLYGVESVILKAVMAEMILKMRDPSPESE